MVKGSTRKPKSYDELTVMQQRFVDYYDGNALQAAEKAGYSKPKQSGSLLLTNVDIVAGLKTREKRRRTHNIWSREDRQRFWTRVASGQECQTVVTGKDKEGNATTESIPATMNERLKASELLGRSEADFTDKLGLGGIGPDGQIKEIPLKFLDPDPAVGEES